MTKSMLQLIGLGVLIFLLFACATKRPVLYPNWKFKAAGRAAAERDIDDCLQMAAAAGLKAEPGKKVAGQAARGAAVGGAVGAGVGAVTGNMGRKTAAGAAGGGAGGLARGVFRSRNPDPVQRRFVEKCLREKGYQPIGWK